jgi:endonuclease/exonuclease/phosphatase family metal-dependent hydrolase
MMSSPIRFRVVTYNIHKCQGFDRKVSPQRIISILHELHGDILCLQEVVNAPGDPLSARGPSVSARGPSDFDQAATIARALPDYAWCFGANRALRGGTYGNMTLTRLPLCSWHNHNLTHARREERGVLQADVELSGNHLLHVFNVHLGTSYAERRHQGRRLLSNAVLADPELHAPRLVLGDFNEWTQGLTTKLLRSTFSTVRPLDRRRIPRAFPGMFPLLTLDHCYYEPPLELEETLLWRTRASLIASDHIPLIADFRLTP